MEEFKMTEEKVRKLIPIIEGILSRRLGKKFIINNMTFAGVTVSRENKEQNK